jgi:hypothetical protein
MSAEVPSQHFVRAAVEETTATLRKQAEAVLAALDELAAAAARVDTTSAATEAIGPADVAALIRRHSLDCTIKLGWAAEAVAMYRQALAGKD